MFGSRRSRLPQLKSRRSPRASLAPLLRSLKGVYREAPRQPPRRALMVTGLVIGAGLLTAAAAGMELRRNPLPRPSVNLGLGKSGPRPQIEAETALLAEVRAEGYEILLIARDVAGFVDQSGNFMLSCELEAVTAAEIRRGNQRWTVRISNPERWSLLRLSVEDGPQMLTLEELVRWIRAQP